MEVITNGCNGVHKQIEGGQEEEERTGAKNVILNTLPHSTNNNVQKTTNGSELFNGGSIKKSINSGPKPKRTHKCAALLADNRYATRIEDMVDEHLKFGRQG